VLRRRAVVAIDTMAVSDQDAARDMSLAKTKDMPTA
jgi:hypothetical protein